MSLKGKKFSANDFPARRRTALQQQGKKEAEINEIIDRWAEAETKRYAIVAMDGKTPIIAEEVMQRALNKMSPKARRISGALMAVDQDTRAEVMKAFYEDGDLKLPFELVR